MKTINLAYKFKLTLTLQQEKIFSSWAGTCRFPYNLCLEYRILSWNQYRKSYNYYDQANELKSLKKVEGEIKNATIRKEADGWYISFCCEKEVLIPENKMPTVGIDRGISETLALSSSDELKSFNLTLPEKCRELRERIKVLQKRLRLKNKFSKSWSKLQKKIRKLHSKITRIRHDFLHKASNYIAKNVNHQKP